MKKILLIAFTGLSLLSCNNAKKEKEAPLKKADFKAYEKIAMANGFENFDSISELKFTFNVTVNDSLRSQRTWQWNTNIDKISLTEKDSSMTYIKNDSVSVENEYIDQRFINDTYWLLFPFQLKWSSAEISEPKKATAPISGKEMQMLTVSYPSEGGYTPGDSYDIYFDENFMVQEWVYKSAGGRELATTWEDYEDYEGIKIAKMHKSQDGTFKLFFTDISVKN